MNVDVWFIHHPLLSLRQRGRRGLGLIIQGLEEERVDWDPAQETVTVKEEVGYMMPFYAHHVIDENTIW